MCRAVLSSNRRASRRSNLSSSACGNFGAVPNPPWVGSKLRRNAVSAFERRSGDNGVSLGSILPIFFRYPVTFWPISRTWSRRFAHASWERNIPRALIFGVALVGVLYMLVNAAVQYVLPAAAIATTERPASDAVALVLGWRGAWLVSAGMALSILAAMNGTIMSGARVPYAVARDRYFFSRARRGASALSTPSGADRCTGRFSIIHCCSWVGISGSFSRWRFSRNGFFTCWPQAQFLCFADAIRTPGGLIGCGVIHMVPSMFVLAAAVLLYYTFADNLMNSALGCLVIVAGIPVFLFFAPNERGGMPDLQAVALFSTCSLSGFPQCYQGTEPAGTLPLRFLP